MRELAFGHLNRVLIKIRKTSWFRLFGKPRQWCFWFQRVKEWIQNFSSQGECQFSFVTTSWFQDYRVFHVERKRARIQTFKFLIAFHMKLTEAVAFSEDWSIDWLILVYVPRKNRDVTITERLQNFGSAPMTLKQGGSLSCHTCCDTGPRCLWSHPKDYPNKSPFTTSTGYWGLS